jgi:outer membrane protein OmpA-like peptidoglycan-associated protein
MLEWLRHPPSSDAAIDRKALAGLLVEIAHNLKPELRSEPNGTLPADLRLEQLRSLVLGREIQVLSRLSDVMEDPERLAAAMGRVLPMAIAEASSDTRLGLVLVPALEKATESSIRNNPRTLVNILYPMIVPAIRKSIVETIDETFQSLNESLKYSLTWRGLRWRWEAWWTGLTFAEVVLKHTLVYQVEHVFLIHRHTGLLISHVAAKDAASQDPQLVSSMLTAIQDFVKDSFSGAEQQGLDTLRLGELTLWSEAGPFATLVAVIRGNPPEVLHETLRNALSRIHAERHHALESFDGDSSGLGEIDAELKECVELRQEAPLSVRPGFPFLARLAIVGFLLLVGLLTFRWWWDVRRWDNYVAQLRAQPGILITDSERVYNDLLVGGLRDPLAADPESMLREAGINPRRVTFHLTPYQALDPGFVLKRLQASLDPPPTVTLAVDGDRIVARGAAPSSWLDRAHAAGRLLPAGAPPFDLSGVQNVNAADERRWQGYVAGLRAQSGIIITELEQHDGAFVIAGLRDPLAADPEQLLREAGIDPARVVARWAPYQALDKEFVLKRLQASLDPPPGIALAVEGDRIVAQGSAPSSWLDRARAAGRMLPAGAPVFDLSGVQNVNDGDERRWDQYVAQLRAQPGILITDLEHRDGTFLVAGLRDPLAADPQQLLREAGIDPAQVVAHWVPYQGLDPQFALKRLQGSLNPPPSVTLAVEGDHIVAQGSASSFWIERARSAGRALAAGGLTFDVSAVRNITEATIGKLRDAIQSREIRFDNNVPLPAAGQEAILDSLARDINEIESVASNIRVTARVTLTGHSDTVGQGTANLSLSLARAEAVRALLKKRGVDPDVLSIRGAGPLEPQKAETSEAARSANRRVSFSIGIEEQQQ